MGSIQGQQLSLRRKIGALDHSTISSQHKKNCRDIIYLHKEARAECLPDVQVVVLARKVGRGPLKVKPKI